jgi:MFS transporter, UMF1 family
MTEIVKGDKRIIKAWTFYDWANSVFPLVITSAIFPNFYEYITSHDDHKNFIGDTVSLFGFEFHNQNIYSYVYAFALFIVVLIAPVLSGIADYYGNKKRFLQFFCYLGAISCMCLFFFDRNHLGLSFIPFVTATIGFWGSLVYYNSYLPEIASAEEQDRVSAKGFAMGYLGSSLLLIICLIAIIVFKMPAKYAFLGVGVWWIAFAQYTFSILPNPPKLVVTDKKNMFVHGFQELKIVLIEVRKLLLLKRFLYSYFFYNMGVQTVMVMAVLFARKEVEWGTGENAEQLKTNSLIISILLIQFVGIAGSFLFSFISKKIGNLKGLMIAIFIWILICVFTYLVVRLPIHFYIVAVSVGLVMGGIQALSRSTYSKLLPETEDHTSYFSFFDVMEKLGMIIGTISFGLISELTGGMRNSILSLIIFFVVGFILLASMPKSKEVS